MGLIIDSVPSKPRGTVVRVVERSDGGPLVYSAVRIRIRDHASVALYGENNNAYNFIAIQGDLVENEHVQFQPSTSETVYAYAFGRSIGQLNVTGIAFIAVCNAAQSQVTGIEHVRQIYENNRFSRAQKPMQVRYGKQVYYSYLTGFSLQFLDPAMNVAQWAFKFATYPITPPTP